MWLITRKNKTTKLTNGRDSSSERQILSRSPQRGVLPDSHPLLNYPAGWPPMKDSTHVWEGPELVEVVTKCPGESTGGTPWDLLEKMSCPASSFRSVNGNVRMAFTRTHTAATRAAQEAVQRNGLGIVYCATGVATARGHLGLRQKDQIEMHFPFQILKLEVGLQMPRQDP